MHAGIYEFMNAIVSINSYPLENTDFIKVLSEMTKNQFIHTRNIPYQRPKYQDY